jgi:hypothetical protein
LSVAVRVSAAPHGKDGFYLQIFPDLRGPQSIYLTGAQLEHLIACAESSGSDTELWAEVAKIPLEPLTPARSLYSRLRSLLTESATPLREEIAAQRALADARAHPEEQLAVQEAEPDPAPPSDLPRPTRDPDAL